ncbi:hypothetical protein AGABI2DRAFT_218980, partial [Agaricus bisporus var. bisporus H97]|uniref:hypothetical protein n=1 Tax=Agaricus bisporus var. bisporus (strain H97 / ATCC MYA-4626 / FGSC 10389) TaxID=936046 RepID=UPI00029F62DB
MSSNEEEYDPSNVNKKRRIQRACDICRRKKSNGVQMPGNRCSNCITNNYECTYVETARVCLCHPIFFLILSLSYVESLENRLQKLEKLLKRVPNSSSNNNNTNNNNTNANDASTPTDNQSVHAFVDIMASILRRYGTTYVQPPPDDDAQIILSDHFKQLSVEQPKDYRFFGKSSGVMLIQTALELKNEYTGKRTWSMKPEDLSLKRDRFWTKPPWEEQTLISLTSTRPPYDFPESDLLHNLVDLYFKHVNIFMPLLHRPTFERAIKEGLHLQDPKFGANVLLVCANGARFCDDPREERRNRRRNRHSSGWKWFEQVQMVRRTFLTPSNLYDLQFYSLSVLFLHGSSAPQACWAMVGVGLRLAQDVGAHRKRKMKGPMTVEDELWKRAFWVLVSIDRGVSSGLGRPCAVHDEDFDIDLPVECDDEYWEHPDPEKRWKQPPGKPSLVASFLCFLKLSQVLAFALRTIYSINKSKLLLGFVDNSWEQLIVAELDSALNRFVDSVPEHLRWDPDRENEEFFMQSVLLWTSYYHVQILIHRPFIPSPSKPSPLIFPSLTICTNAARSCIHVVDVLHRRFGLVYPPVQMAVFTSSIVLLLSIWGGKRNGLMTDAAKEMKDVHKSMTILKSSETLWHSAGRLWDLLYELASVGDLPLPQPSAWNSNKRERNSDSPISSNVSENANTPPLGPRTVAGSRRVSHSNRRRHHQRQQHVTTPPMFHHHPTTSISEASLMGSSTMTQQAQSGMVNLPLYSDELG